LNTIAHVRERDRARDVIPEAPATEPAAVGLDLGSAYTRIWVSGRPMLHVPTISESLTNPVSLIRRGRIADGSGLQALLERLVRRYPRPVPAGAVLVACRPVLADADDDLAVRRLLADVFDPSRVLFIDTVRAAAVGAGAGPGVQMVVDVGAQLTEVAILAGAGVTAARRAELGANDFIRPATPEVLVGTIVRLVGELRRDPGSRALASTAVSGGLLLVGGGASRPGLAAALAGALQTAVRSAARPRVTAVHGAGLAALSVLRRTAAVNS
jgi:rod shape-determining protein MreB